MVADVSAFSLTMCGPVGAGTVGGILHGRPGLDPIHPMIILKNWNQEGAIADKSTALNTRDLTDIAHVHRSQ